MSCRLLIVKSKPPNVLCYEFLENIDPIFETILPIKWLWPQNVGVFNVTYLQIFPQTFFCVEVIPRTQGSAIRLKTKFARKSWVLRLNFFILLESLNSFSSVSGFIFYHKSKTCVNNCSSLKSSVFQYCIPL